MNHEARALALRRIVVYWVVAFIAALIVGWPVISCGHSLQCTLTSIGAIVLLFAALIHVGDSRGIGRWLWGVIAVLLSFGAPLTIELCINDNLRYWWVGLGFAFLALTTLIVWRSWQEAGPQTPDS